jgi:hypothetical protein
LSWVVQPVLDPLQTYYEISMETLSGSEYLYVQDDEIQVRVKSSNQFGYGDYSTVLSSNTVVLRSLPHQMLPVTRNQNTDFNAIVVDWTALASGDDGNSQILGYNVQWKLTSAATWVDLILPEATFTDL